MDPLRTAEVPPLVIWVVAQLTGIPTRPAPNPTSQHEALVYVAVTGVFLGAMLIVVGAWIVADRLLSARFERKLNAAVREAADARRRNSST